MTMVTKQGLIKRTPLEQYANIRKSGLIGIALNEGDALAWTRLTSGHDMLIVATRNGQAIRFNEADARPMGRSGHGVRAIRLAEGDEVVGVCICREGGTVLTVTENGKGRRSDIDTYRITARGGKGIRNYDAAKDKVAAVKIVDDVDDVLLSSQEGIIIRLHANEIPLQSRYGSGVRVMRSGRERQGDGAGPHRPRRRGPDRADRHLRCRCRAHRRAAGRHGGRRCSLCRRDPGSGR